MHRTDPDRPMISDEAPRPGAHDRRTFLKLFGLSVAAGALSGCRPPKEKIVPHLMSPPETTPGVPKWYATTCHGCSAACGALVKTYDGRPIKLEGNPEHALSMGGLCAIGQASVVGLYDPYRQRRPAHRGSPSDLAQADADISRHLLEAKSGAGRVVVLTGGTVGPTTRALIGEFLSQFPTGQHIHMDPLPLPAMREGYRLACGLSGVPAMRFDRARTIVSFGADFLGTWLSPVAFSKQYSDARSRNGGVRHIQIESRLSLTGSNADRRFCLSPSQQARCAAIVLLRVARSIGVALPASVGRLETAAAAEVRAAAEATAAELLANRGHSIVVCDSDLPSVQTVVAALNDLLGNIGGALDPGRPLASGSSDAEIAGLVEDMEAGKVRAIFIHGCNPAHTWPQRSRFAAALEKVPCSVSTAVAPDETSRAVVWHIPAHHPMETWGDAEPEQGIYSIVQPTIRPLYRTRAFEEGLLAWLGRKPDFHAYLMAHWRASIWPAARGARQGAAGETFETFWDAALQSGCVVAPPAAVERRGGPHMAAVTTALDRIASADTPGEGYEIELYETVALRDGAWANNAWLQELPDPITKITWGAGASVAPGAVGLRGITDGDWIAIPQTGTEGRETASASLEFPITVQPGQHAGTISVPVGYGRTDAGPVAAHVGVDAYSLMRLENGRRVRVGYVPTVARVTTRSRHRFARTQVHDLQEGRDLARSDHGGESASHGHTDFAEEQRKATLWGKPLPYTRQWGLVIDLNRCTGCSACVVACDIENNVPAVGPDEVARNRDMHWMRIDRYYEGDADNPRVLHQPMMCQHCANASCESVCPVLATVHDDQGLNVQVYNRCVGTRYCANNCPYKVRRFNWFDNQSRLAPRRLGLNPSVTVRSRGVMEKCSLCLHRIQEARIRARNEGREVQDGEIHTACEQSCPADAIVFGDLMDPNSRVSRLAADRRAYRVLEELNRAPAVRYLVRSGRTNSEEGG